ncbi:MAG TPA: hypothetical protein PKE38_15745, partial [Ignavibacteriaceae bacterium]|nr:hypothetical protein [Ignavibacteriaceae bacterium]
MIKLIANIKLKSSLLLLLLLSSLFYIDVKSQSDIIESNELIYLNDDLNEEIIADSLDQKKDDITISALPFA